MTGKVYGQNLTYLKVPVKKIAAGEIHTVALDDLGNVWTWGRNVDSQLGYETAPDNFGKQPKAISKLPEVEQFTQIAAGAYHTVALDENGNVWTWGYNGYGQLGDGTNTKRNTPVAVNKPDGVEKFTQITTGWYHTVAIDEDGDIWTWGNNEYGQLGNGTSGSYKKTPVAVNKEQGLKTAVQVAAGAEHTVALDSQGSIWGWGNNYHGYLGDGSKSNNRNVPVQSLVYTTPIQLTADTSDNDADHDLEITFPKNKTFQRYINGIKVDGHSLEEGDYTVEDGKIILHQSETNPYLRKAGDVTITVSAKYYPDSMVEQTINAGAQAEIKLEQEIGSPIVNKGLFRPQPILHILDKNGNLCTYDNTTEVTVSKNDGGDWELEGTKTVRAQGGKVIFNNLRAIHDEKVEGAQLCFSVGGMWDVISNSVTLPAKSSEDVPEIESIEEGDQSVKLTWRKATGSTHYGVYVRTVSESYTTPSAITVNLDYEITGLNNGQTYYFAVTAIHEEDERWSNEVSAVPRTVPEPPRNVKATAGNKKAVVNFDEPLEDGGRPILKYVVTSYPGNIKAEGTKSPITVKGLTNGKDYTFIVKAINEAGESKESEPSNTVKPKSSSGGGTSGDSGRTTSEVNKESDKEKQDSKLGVIIEINGKQFSDVAKGIIKAQNGKQKAELVIDEGKLKELIHQEKGQLHIRFIFDKAPEGKEIEYYIYSLSKELAQYSGYVELLIPLSEQIDQRKVVTGVRIDKDGSYTHVPTKVIAQQSKKYAGIKTLLGGTYTVISEERFFKDMKGHWAEETVNELASRRILDNIGKENLVPNKKATRAEFAQIITKALGLMQKGVGKDLFRDVSEEDTYYDAVTLANEYGIISGYGNGNFRPDKEITREESMVMMIRAMKVAKVDVSLNEEEVNTLLSRYKDNSNISPWAREYVAICIKLGIVEGRPNGTVAPKDSISMAEMAVMIHRLLRSSDLM